MLWFSTVLITITRVIMIYSEERPQSVGCPSTQALVEPLRQVKEAATARNAIPVSCWAPSIGSLAASNRPGTSDGPIFPVRCPNERTCRTLTKGWRFDAEVRGHTPVISKVWLLLEWSSRSGNQGGLGWNSWNLEINWSRDSFIYIPSKRQECWSMSYFPAFTVI